MEVRHGSRTGVSIETPVGQDAALASSGHDAASAILRAPAPAPTRRYQAFQLGCAARSAYGNRMAGQYAGDPKGSKRHTYRISLGRRLNERGDAALQWAA